METKLDLAYKNFLQGKTSRIDFSPKLTDI